MLASPLHGSNRLSDIWIEVTDSQRKFEPHQDDSDDSKYDHERLTFEVLTWSRTPFKSSLYMDYLPILEDRGVSRNALKKFVEVALDNEKDNFLAALNDDISLLKWIQDESSSGPADSTASTRWRGAFPSALREKAKILLEVGSPPNPACYATYRLNLERISSKSIQILARISKRSGVRALHADRQLVEGACEQINQRPGYRGPFRPSRPKRNPPEFLEPLSR